MEEARLSGVGRGFQSDGSTNAKQRLPKLSKRHLATLKGMFGVQRDNNLERYAGALQRRAI